MDLDSKNPIAICGISQLYTEGRMPGEKSEENLKKGFEQMLKAAALNFSRAQTFLSNLYAKGIGTQVNLMEVERLRKEAIENTIKYWG